MKKAIIITLTVLASLTGIFFYARYQIRLHNTIKYLAGKTVLLENFIVVSFPDQTEKFNTSLKK